jgi:hypothetical protein
MAWCHVLLDPSDPLYVSLPFACWFVVSTAAWSVFSLQDSALTGLRASVWIPLENAAYGVVKLGLLVVVAQTSLSDGAFTSWTLPVLALLVPVNLLLFRRLVPRHTASTADPSVPGRQVLTLFGPEPLQTAGLVDGTALLAGPVGLTAVGWSALAAEGIPALLLGPSVVRWLRRGQA